MTMNDNENFMFIIIDISKYQIQDSNIVYSIDIQTFIIASLQ